MKIVRFIVLASFYVPYYTALLFITILNLFKLIYTLFHQTPNQKPKISPFEIVHKDVFATLCNSSPIQMISFPIKVLRWKSILSRLLTKFHSKCGDSISKINKITK